MADTIRGLNDSGGDGMSGGGAFGRNGGKGRLAVVTGASSGIGLELARVCALNGFDLVVAAENSKIKEAGQRGPVCSIRRSGRRRKTMRSMSRLPGLGALMSNKGSVVYGLKNKLQVAAARVAPKGWIAEAHRLQAQPSGGQRL